MVMGLFAPRLVMNSRIILKPWGAWIFFVRTMKDYKQQYLIHVLVFRLNAVLVGEISNELFISLVEISEYFFAKKAPH